MLLSVECSRERTTHRTDGHVRDTSEVDISSESPADFTISTCHHIGEILQVLCGGNLVDAIFLVKGKDPLATCPNTYHGQKHEK